MQKLPQTSTDADETAEAIIAGYVQRSGVRLLHHEGNRSFYQPLTDSIALPLRAQFREAAFFGSEALSKEELIAEIGAATLVNHADLETPDNFRNNTTNTN